MLYYTLTAYRLNLIRRRMFKNYTNVFIKKKYAIITFYNEGREHNISNTNTINGINTHILRLTSKLIYIYILYIIHV